ncbi:MAG: PAS domain-containing sensor histidine kinase [Longimicrobiales bacterium]|nr:PAS domain-containing sensor histidine kinase [Longimicrobiales bacterium]
MLSPEEFQAVFDAAPDGVAVVDSEGVIRAANPKMEQIFGWPPQELVGQTVEVLLPEAVRDVHRGHRAGFVRRPHDRPMGVGLDLRGVRKDGTDFPVEVSLSPWQREGGELRIICSVRDVSAYRRLRNFSEGALRATEEERKRIARELHDDTAQRLATLILRVGVLAREEDHLARGALFEDVRQEIVDAADAVKRMARGLRPPEIEELGLGLALRAHVRSLEESGFRVSARLGDVDGSLDATEKLAIYRIVQEALSNARRHSGAPAASLRLFQSDGEVVAEVTDRGRGFDPSIAVEGSAGLGLLGMQERATMIGGRMDVDSETGRGTRIRVTVPVSMDAQE